MYTNTFNKDYMIENPWFFIGTLIFIGLVLLVIRVLS